MKIVVVPRKMEPFMVEVDGAESTVSELKEKISNTCGIKTENQTLVVKGKVIEDGPKLQEFKLHNMSKVFLALKKDKNPKKPKQQVFNRDEPPIYDIMRKASTEDISNCIESLKKMLPEYSYMFNDVETVEEILSESKNPDAQLEKQRALDRMMDKNENEPSGFQELVSRYYKIEEILEKNAENAAALFKTKTVIPERPESPSTTRLPSPFGVEAAISSLLRIFQILPERNEQEQENDKGRDLWTSLATLWTSKLDSDESKSPISKSKPQKFAPNPKKDFFSAMIPKKSGQGRSFSITPIGFPDNPFNAFTIEEDPINPIFPEFEEKPISLEFEENPFSLEETYDDSFNDDLDFSFVLGESDLDTPSYEKQVSSKPSYIPNVMCPPPNTATPTPPTTTNDTSIPKPRVLQLRRKQQEQNGITKQNE